MFLENKFLYGVLYNVFKRENNDFSRPSVDDCEVCLRFNDHVKENSENHNSDNCEVCIGFKKHKEKYTLGRMEYQKPVSNDTVYFTAEMPKVIVLPKLASKEHVFTSRLVTFN